MPEGDKSRITPRTASAEAILAAARRAIAQRGPGKLTLSAVAAEAGVSRPTLYRWFPTKSHLLAAITEYETEQFDLGLSSAIENSATDNNSTDSAADAKGSTVAQLGAALSFLVNYLEVSMGNDPIGVDPAYALQSLAAALEPQSKTLALRLGDALAHVPAVEAGVLSEQQAAEILLRIVFSHYLMPHPDPEVMLNALRVFAGLEPVATNPAAERR